MSTIIWPAKLGGPRIERIGPKRRYQVAPRRPRLQPGPGPLASAVVLFVVAVLEIVTDVTEWWDERRRVIYLERKP